MRQNVKGTKWITKCRVGLRVGGCWMKSVIFQHPWVFSVLKGGAQTGERETARGWRAIGRQEGARKKQRHQI